MRVLIIDDQRSARRALANIVSEVGLEQLAIYEAGSLDEAMVAIREHSPDCALVDVRLSSDPANRDGLRIIQELRQTTSAVPIVVTVFNDIHEIRAAMRSGAADYILKDELCPELVGPILQSVQNQRRLEQEVVGLRSGLAGEGRLESIVGSSAVMEALKAVVRRVVLSDRPVLVTGPTGSGKEVVVQAIHALGPHAQEPLLDLNCGAIPDTLMESHLFGHQKGAFTGADRPSVGYLGAVGRGTLFLDEIGELSLPLQSKLLRTLETGQYRPLGAVESKQFAGRIVAATHADLEARVKEGKFREDLLFRLNVLVVRVPGLDEHREDIPALVGHFLGKQSRQLRFSAEAMELLMHAPWPGNVRQLRNLIDRLTVFVEGELVTPAELERAGLTMATKPTEGATLEGIAQLLLSLPLANKLESIERALVDAALVAAKGNKTAAARLLGVHRKAVERRVAGSPESAEKTFTPDPD